MGNSSQTKKMEDKNKNKKEEEQQTEVAPTPYLRRKKIEEPPSSEEIGQTRESTKSRTGGVIDKKTRKFIPELSDFHLQINKLNRKEVAFFNEVMESSSILGNGEFVEKEISGGKFSTVRR